MNFVCLLSNCNGVEYKKKGFLVVFFFTTNTTTTTSYPNLSTVQHLSMYLSETIFRLIFLFRCDIYMKSQLIQTYHAPTILNLYYFYAKERKEKNCSAKAPPPPKKKKKPIQHHSSYDSK